jgi:hypothetical protein
MTELFVGFENDCRVLWRMGEELERTIERVYMNGEVIGTSMDAENKRNEVNDGLFTLCLTYSLNASTTSKRRWT